MIWTKEMSFVCFHSMDMLWTSICLETKKLASTKVLHSYNMLTKEVRFLLSITLTELNSENELFGFFFSFLFSFFPAFPLISLLFNDFSDFLFVFLMFTFFVESIMQLITRRKSLKMTMAMLVKKNINLRKKKKRRKRGKENLNTKNAKKRNVSKRKSIKEWQKKNEWKQSSNKNLKVYNCIMIMLFDSIALNFFNFIIQSRSLMLFSKYNLLYVYHDCFIR